MRGLYGVKGVSVVLADTEDTLTPLFREKKRAYKRPCLVLSRDAVKSACGMAQSAVGPFYCSAYQQVYIHPPSQEIPYLCGEKCYRHPLQRDVALHAGRMTAPSCLGVAPRAKPEA